MPHHYKFRQFANNPERMKEPLSQFGLRDENALLLETPFSIGWRNYTKLGSTFTGRTLSPLVGDFLRNAGREEEALEALEGGRSVVGTYGLHEVPKVQERTRTHEGGHSALHALGLRRSDIPMRSRVSVGGVGLTEEMLVSLIEHARFGQSRDTDETLEREVNKVKKFWGSKPVAKGSIKAAKVLKDPEVLALIMSLQKTAQDRISDITQTPGMIHFPSEDKLRSMGDLSLRFLLSDIFDRD